MNFKIIENSPSIWDKEEEIIKLYNQGLLIKEISEKLNVSSPALSRVLKKLKSEGKIIPRDNRGKTKKKKRTPKYYHRTHPNGGFCICKKRVHYGYVKTARQAERFVELLKECNWDKSQCQRIKEEVMHE